ncbi:hypothetical protein XENTR_v10018691 [Xenopus tropicalis]|nr:hypothetical protein XENTR_v10018691 [Xenopus tropicalis]
MLYILLGQFSSSIIKHSTCCIYLGQKKDGKQAYWRSPSIEGYCSILELTIMFSWKKISTCILFVLSLTICFISVLLSHVSKIAIHIICYEVVSTGEMKRMTDVLDFGQCS